MDFQSVSFRSFFILSQISDLLTLERKKIVKCDCTQGCVGGINQSVFVVSGIGEDLDLRVSAVIHCHYL